MDDNSNKVRRCGQIGEGADDEVSMEDVLEEQQRLQADASAVLGASDPHNCTYPKGYLKRQALYACATCTPNGNAGVCLACSYACHEGHDLYELYTKRFFSCDCGNAKFAGNECKLIKEKQMNSRNHYNQNFKGLYCSCARPYPDPEDSVEDEMIQCIICEDWHHGRHLKTPVLDEFSEMVCPECMSKFPFLWAYHVFSLSDVVKREEEKDLDKVINVEISESVSDRKVKNEATKSESGGDSETLMCGETEKDVSSSKNGERGMASNSNPNNFSEGTSKTDSSESVSCKRERDTSEEEELQKTKVLKTEASLDLNNKEECLLQSLQKREYDVLEQAVFWPQGWRSKLCRCQNCLEMFRDKDIEFLLDETDTVQAYEEAGSQNGTQVTEEEAEENIFAGMHHVQKIEIARGVRDLKTGLNEFLKGFAREGKVVTESDIREFFQSLEEKRKQRANLPQDNCR